MKTVKALLRRNIKLFFKDKGMFFTALITPCILLLLYVTFLGNIYEDTFLSAIPQELHSAISDKTVNGFVGGQLISSILAVSCVTVAFCSNMLMVQDKASGVLRDFTVSPVKDSHMAVSYYSATLISTLLICFAATAICLIYIALIGWYLSLLDVLLLLLDILLLVLFGTAISSIVNLFLSTQGQISAVGSIVSSTYGFISGAYMPISQFSKSLQHIIGFLPGTYGTSLVRNHAMRGVFSALEEASLPEEAIKELKNIVDCNLYFFEREVSSGVKYLILCGSTLLLFLLYVLLHLYRSKRKNKSIST